MRLAMAISPSRRQQFHRAHLAQIHAHRVVGAVDGFLFLFGDEQFAVVTAILAGRVDRLDLVFAANLRLPRRLPRSRRY
jgi:hypothetical protein